MKFVGSRQKQRGATFLGILIIGSILMFAVYAGIRLVPVYKEFMDVSRAMTQAAQTLGSNASPGEIRNSLERRWEVDDIKSIKPKEVEIQRIGNTTILRAQYRAEADFIANIKLVVDFDKSVTMGNAAGP